MVDPNYHHQSASSSSSSFSSVATTTTTSSSLLIAEEPRVFAPGFSLNNSNSRNFFSSQLLPHQISTIQDPRHRMHMVNSAPLLLHPQQLHHAPGGNVATMLANHNHNHNNHNNNNAVPLPSAWPFNGTTNPFFSPEAYPTLPPSPQFLNHELTMSFSGGFHHSMQLSHTPPPFAFGYPSYHHHHHHLGARIPESYLALRPPLTHQMGLHHHLLSHGNNGSSKPFVEETNLSHPAFLSPMDPLFGIPVRLDPRLSSSPPYYVIGHVHRATASPHDNEPQLDVPHTSPIGHPIPSVGRQIALYPARSRSSSSSRPVLIPTYHNAGPVDPQDTSLLYPDVSSVRMPETTASVAASLLLSLSTSPPREASPKLTAVLVEKEEETPTRVSPDPSTLNPEYTPVCSPANRNLVESASKRRKSSLASLEDDCASDPRLQTQSPQQGTGMRGRSCSVNISSLNLHDQNSSVPTSKKLSAPHMRTSLFNSDLLPISSPPKNHPHSVDQGPPTTLVLCEEKSFDRATKTADFEGQRSLKEDGHQLLFGSRSFEFDDRDLQKKEPSSPPTSPDLHVFQASAGYGTRRSSTRSNSPGAAGVVSSSEKRYPCSICGKEFGNASNLRRHKRLHTGAKPYSCMSCGKKFNNSSNRHVHQRTCENRRSRSNDNSPHKNLKDQSMATSVDAPYNNSPNDEDDDLDASSSSPSADENDQDS